MESCSNNSDLCTGPNGESLPPWKKELIRKRRQVNLPNEAPEEQEAETSTGDQNKSDRGRTRSRVAPSRAAGLVAALQAVYEPRVDSNSPTRPSAPLARMATPGAEQPASNPPHPAGVSHSNRNRAPAEGFTSASRSVSANGRAHIRSTTQGGVQTQSHVTTSSSAKTWSSSSSVPLKSTVSTSSTSSAAARDKMVEEKRPPRSDVVVAPLWKFSAKNVSVHYKENNEDEELQYGPGIVNRLKSRYLSRTLREKSHSERPSLRRAASLEDWLDKEDPPVETSDFMRKKTTAPSARPTSLNTSNQATRNYQLKKTASSENCSLGTKRSVSVSDLYIAPSLSGNMRGRAAQRGTPTPGSSSPSPVKPSIPPVKEEIIIIEKKSPPVETVKKPAAPTSVAPLKTRRALPTTTLYGVEDGELPPPDTVRQVKSIFEPDARKTGSSRRSQSAGPSTNRIPLSLARPTNDDSRTSAKATPTKASAPISPKPSPLGPKPTVLPPKPVLAKTRPTQPPPPLPQSPVAPPPTTPRTPAPAPAPPVVATPPAPISSPVASSTPRTVSAAAVTSSPAAAATPPAAAPRPAFSTPTTRPAAPAPPVTYTPPPAPVTVPTPTPAPITTPKQNPSIAAAAPPAPTSQSSNAVAPPTLKDDQSDSSCGSDDENEPGEGKGVKKISRGALDNIRKEGTSQVFAFGGKGTPQQQQQQPPVKQVGIIRPLTIDSVKPDNVDKKKAVEDTAPVAELIKPPPVAVEPAPPPAKVGSANKTQPRNNEVPSGTAAAKTPNETNNPNVKINGVSNSSNNNKAKKRHQEESATTVFNFTERKQVPDHIHNDGVKRPISRYKRDDSGIVILVRPGGTNESSDYIDDADDEVDFLRRPPSPCNVHFEGWNVVINGRSSLQRQPKPRKLNISFNDEMTMLFEYPSEISLLLDDSDDSAKPSLATTPSSTGNLASYTPSKVVVGESFELGVSRIVSSAPRANPQPSPAPVEEYLKPADVETTWSAETSADLLF